MLRPVILLELLKLFVKLLSVLIVMDLSLGDLHGVITPFLGDTTLRKFGVQRNVGRNSESIL